MSKKRNFQSPYPEYEDPFITTHSNPKHAFRQIGGETELSQHDIIWKVQTRKGR